MKKPRLRHLAPVLALLSLLLLAGWWFGPNNGLNYVTDSDPTAGSGVSAPLWQTLVRTDSPSLYAHTGNGPNDWTKVGIGSGGAGGSGDGTTISTSSPFSVIATAVQSRVTGSCGAGNAVRAVAQDGTVTCQAIGVGTASAGQAITAISSAGAVTTAAPEEATPRTFIKGDMLSASSLASNGLVDGHFTIALSGTGTAITSTNGEVGHDGIFTLDMGTTTTGRGSLSLQAVNPFLLGGGTVTVDVIFRQPTLCDGATDVCTIRCGLLDNVAGESVDGVYFKFDPAASANVRVVTVANNVKTEQDTSPAQTFTAGAFFHGRFTVNAAASSVTFSVVSAGVATAVGTVATNIPSGAGRQTGLGCMALKSAGTTSRKLDVDLVQYEDVYTTVR